MTDSCRIYPTSVSQSGAGKHVAKRDPLHPSVTFPLPHRNQQRASHHHYGYQTRSWAVHITSRRHTTPCLVHSVLLKLRPLLSDMKHLSFINRYTLQRSQILCLPDLKYKKVLLKNIWIKFRVYFITVSKASFLSSFNYCITNYLLLLSYQHVFYKPEIMPFFDNSVLTQFINKISIIELQN